MAKQTQRKKFDGVKCLTPTFRASYLTVFTPRAYEDGPEKYSVEMLFDAKKSDLTDMKKKMQAIAVAAWGKDKTKWPKNFRWPFKDGAKIIADAEDMPEETQAIYTGMLVARADSLKPVGIFDQQRQDIIDQKDIFSGCFCRASLWMVPYENIGGKGAEGRSGIKLYLQGVQLVKKGEPFGNAGAKNDFDELPVDDEDTSSETEDETSDEDDGFDI